MAAVVLVGARDGALAAAERLGLTSYLISETRPARIRRAHLAGLFVAPFERRRTAFIASVNAAFPQLAREKPQAVVALTERSVLPAAWLREHWGLPGNGSKTALRCRDKLQMKEHARACGLPCADFSALDGRVTPVQLVKRLGLPLVLKPRDASGSRGTEFIRSLADIPARLGSSLIAESQVHGLEMSVESLILDGQVRFVNLSEYLLPLWANVVPAALGAEQEQKVRELNARLIESFGVVRGMVHIELFLTHGGVVFGEMALRPPGGQLMRLMEQAYGFDPWQAALQIEQGICPELPERARTHAGVWFIHPGPGKVTRMQGLGVAERVPGAFEVSCRARVGDFIAARGGSGESIGHVMVEGATRSAVVEGLERARRAIVVEVEPPDAPPRSRKSN